MPIESFVILLISLLLTACGSEKSEQEILNDLADRAKADRDAINAQIQAQRDALIAERDAMIARLAEQRRQELLASFKLEDSLPSDFSQKICRSNDALAVKDFFTESALVQFKNSFAFDCASAQEATRTFPTMTSLFKSDNGVETHYFWSFNKSGLVQNFFKLEGKSIVVKHEMLPMSDSTKLSTFLVTKKGNTRGTFLIRTASYQKEPKRYATYIKTALDVGFNVVVQEVRGTRYSEGTLRWMDKLNKNDAKDMLTWLEQNASFPGKVVAFGEGYDAINALAAGLNKNKNLQSVISCSAPWNYSTQTYKYDMLKYVWEGEMSQPYDKLAEKITGLRLEGIPLKQMDELLFGRVVTEWQEYVQARENKSLENFWRQRNVLKNVRGIKAPVVHAVGLKADPTAHEVFNRYSRWKSNNKHRLYLHKEGVGCGDLFSSRFIQDYIGGTSRRPLIYRYFAKRNNYLSVGSLSKNIKQQKIPLEWKRPALFNLFPRFETLFGFDNVSALRLNSLEDKMKVSAVSKRRYLVNGPISLNFRVMSRTENSSGLLMSLEKENQRSVAFSQHLFNERVNKVDRVMKETSSSALFVLNKDEKLNLMVGTKVPDDFDTPIDAFKKDEGDQKMNILVVPKEQRQESYLTVPVESFRR